MDLETGERTVVMATITLLRELKDLFLYNVTISHSFSSTKLFWTCVAAPKTGMQSKALTILVQV